MEGKPIPRSSIHSSQHAAVDFQLKSLKVITRRFQSALTLHETELKILQRLVYRNSNQHRSALFWRNVTELRRYCERVGNLRFLDKMQSLRYTFHGSPDSSSKNFMKGPWTHFPDEENLLEFSKSLQTFKNLTSKMSEICSRAYASFHLSLQSGAFLSLLLVFVSIASRLCMVSSELKEACEQADLCVSSLLILYQHPDKPDLNNQSADKPRELPATQRVNSNTTDIRSPLNCRAELDMPLSGPSHVITPPKSTVIIERQVLSKAVKRPVGNDHKVDQSKKKRKTTRNEIDDIFGT